MQKIGKIPLKIIALYAPCHGAGKSTAAKYLGDVLDAEIVSFAKELSAMVKDLLVRRFNLPVLHRGKDDPLPPPMENVTTRDFMVAIGQAARSVYPDIWVDLTRRNIRTALIGRFTQEPRSVIVDDLRMPNEYAMLREMGAIMVRITRPGLEIIPSETEAQLEGDGYEWNIQLVNEAPDVIGFYEYIRRTLIPLVRGKSA